MADATIKVFLADDHAMVRQGLAALLCEAPDIRVVGQCGDGLKVVDEVLLSQPDVVILDIQMPGLNGLDSCRELVRKNRGLSVLILTMYDDEQLIARALEYGASGYLLKDAACDQLTKAIRAVARGERFVGPGISRSALQPACNADDDPYERLTTRERQVLQLIAEGKTNRMVALQLGLAVKTVDTHRSRLMRKLNIHDQTSLVKYALRKGVVTLH